MPSEEEQSRERSLGDDEQTASVQQKQEARAYLREHFLRCMTALVGRAATFHMHENTTVTATFRGCDIDVQNFCVSNLSTALGCQPAAILRADDVINFTVEDFAVASPNK
ncbi:unnamed protein product [Ixodes pacificus]